MSKGLEQVSFRLLLPTNLAGGLIGKKGLIIKGIEEETGACDNQALLANQTSSKIGRQEKSE